MQKNDQFTVVFFSYFLWTGLSAGFAATEGLVPSLFVFGDSLVDVGNNNYLPLSVAKANYNHNGIDFPTREPTGRLCNGKNSADLLAEKLGLPSPPAYLSLKRNRNASAVLTGVNFASNGAGIFNNFFQTLGQVIPLSQQIQDYLHVHQELMNQLQSSEAQYDHLSKSLFMIVIGSNDLLTYVRSPIQWWKTNPQKYTRSMATKLEEQLKRLYDHGARKFLVVGVGQIGCTPKRRAKNLTQGCNEEANMWSSMYNEALKKMLEGLRQELHGLFSYSYFDIYKAMNDIFANPAAYGFTDVKSACCKLGNLKAFSLCIPFSKYCLNRTRHFFWDPLGHPTEAAAGVLVNHMFDGSSSSYSFPLNVEQLVSLGSRDRLRWCFEGESCMSYFLSSTYLQNCNLFKPTT